MNLIRFLVVVCIFPVVDAVAPACIALCAGYLTRRFIMQSLVDAVMDDTNECPICLETSCNDGVAPWKCSQCSTKYHTACISSWLERSQLCPTCNDIVPGSTPTPRPVRPHIPTALEISRRYDSLYYHDALLSAQNDFSKLVKADTLPLLEFVAPRVPDLPADASLPATRDHPELPRFPLNKIQWEENCAVVGHYVKVRMMRPKMSPDSDDLIWQQLSDRVQISGFIVNTGPGTCTIADFGESPTLTTVFEYPSTSSSPFPLITPHSAGVAKVWRDRVIEYGLWPLLPYLNTDERIEHAPGLYVRVFHLGVRDKRVDIIKEDDGMIVRTQGAETIFVNIAKGSNTHGEVVELERRDGVYCDPNTDKEFILRPALPSSSLVPASLEIFEKLHAAQVSFAQRPRQLQTWFPVFEEAYKHVWGFIRGPDRGMPLTPQTLDDQSNACKIGQRVEVSVYEWKKFPFIKSLVDRQIFDSLVNQKYTISWTYEDGWSFNYTTVGVVTRKSPDECTVVSKLPDGSEQETSFPFYLRADQDLTKFSMISQSPLDESPKAVTSDQVWALRDALLAEPGMSKFVVDKLLSGSKRDVQRGFSRLCDPSAELEMSVSVTRNRLLEIFMSVVNADETAELVPLFSDLSLSEETSSDEEQISSIAQILAWRGFREEAGLLKAAKKF